MTGLSPCDLHVPHKDWSSDPREAQNYLEMERWATHFRTNCGPAPGGPGFTFPDMGISARADTSYVYPAGQSVIRQRIIYDFNDPPLNAILDYEMDGVYYTGWLVKPGKTWIAPNVTIQIPGSDAFTRIDLEMRRQSDGSVFYTWTTMKGDNGGSGDTFSFYDQRMIVNMDEPMWTREYITLTTGGSVAVAPGYGDVYLQMGTFLPF
jgi:hypothetical protein